MASREQEQRATLDALQMDDVSQDRALTRGLAEAQGIAQAIAAESLDGMARFAASKLACLLGELAELERQDSSRHKVRGGIQQLMFGSGGAKPTAHPRVPQPITTSRSSAGVLDRPPGDDRRAAGRGGEAEIARKPDVALAVDRQNGASHV